MIGVNATREVSSKFRVQSSKCLGSTASRFICIDGVFDKTGGRGLLALHFTDAYGGMQASVSEIGIGVAIEIEIEKPETRGLSVRLSVKE